MASVWLSVRVILASFICFGTGGGQSDKSVFLSYGPTEYFTKNTHHKVVILYRQGDIQAPLESYCCRIPDSNGEIRTFCANHIAITCSALPAIENGTIAYSSDTTDSINYGITATYQCDSGYELTGGDTVRTCTGDGSSPVGQWNGTAPVCIRTITCTKLSPPYNGEISVAPGPNSLGRGLGSVATYSCDPGYSLVGQTTRTCKDTNGGTVTTGTWSGTPPTCEGTIIDCQNTPCRYEQIVCQENGNCAIYCHDSKPDACFQIGVVCPSGIGNCTINCDDSNACAQAKTTCSQGDCTVNCENDNTCQSSIVECSGDNCLLSCKGQHSCAKTALKCYSENCTKNCDYDYSCNDTFLQCFSGNCTLNCRDYYSCRYSTVLCSSAENGQCHVYCDGDVACQNSNFTCLLKGNCTFHFEGYSSSNEWIGAYTNITCQENSTCHVICAGQGRSNDHQCSSSNIICPRESGRCTVECSGYYACSASNIDCGREKDCLSCSGHYSCQKAVISFSTTDVSILNCTGYYSCRYASVLCPQNSDCTILCDGQHACNYARVTCPTGDHSCNILCTDPQSCSNLRITNTHNVNLQCCESTDNIKCTHYTSVETTLIGCYHIEVTCPTISSCTINCDNRHKDSCYNTEVTCLSGSMCTINCNDYKSCNFAAITCPTDSNCTINCDGQYSCHRARVTCLTESNCAVICNGRSLCQYTELICPTGSNCTISCDGWYSCQYAKLTCPTGNNCTINCDGQLSCNNARVTCPTGDYSCNVLCTDPQSCQGLRITNTHNTYLECCGSETRCAGTSVVPTSTECHRTKVTCLNGSSCIIYCNDSDLCYNVQVMCPVGSDCTLHCSNRDSCDFALVTCPTGNDCSIGCDGQSSCSHTEITCPTGSDCEVNCNGENSCWYTELICSTGKNCTINCDGRDSCLRTRVTCPTGDYSCNILCTDPESCLLMSVVNTHNVYIECCGSQTTTRCGGTSVVPSSTECGYRAEVTCPTGSNCIINCDYYSMTCYNSNITCSHISNCTVNCDGPETCDYAKVTCPAYNNCAINCNNYFSCQNTEIICPTENNCTIVCNEYSCENARVICPTGDYSCNILCTDAQSCENLRITNTHNVNLQCCESETECAYGSNVVPTLTECST